MDNYIRTVKLFDGFTLEMRQVDSRHYLKPCIYYAIADAEGEPIFEGDDIHLSPLCDAYSIDAAVAVADFLSMRPGDADDDLFEGFSPERLAWVEKHGDEMSAWAEDRRFMAEPVDIYPETVMECFAYALLSGEVESIEDEGEREDLEQFLAPYAGMVGEWVHGTFDEDTLSMVENPDSYFGRCDVTGQRGTVVDVSFVRIRGRL